MTISTVQNFCRKFWELETMFFVFISFHYFVSAVAIMAVVGSSLELLMLVYLLETVEKWFIMSDTDLIEGGWSVVDTERGPRFKYGAYLKDLYLM